jgi:hypothetical protein
MKIMLHHLCKLLLATSALHQESKGKIRSGEKSIETNIT